MPIDLDSEAWENANTEDPIKVHINSLFRENQDQAFSIKEIEEHLVEEKPHVFPSDLVDEGAIEGAKAARQSLVEGVLNREYWHLRVTFRCVSEEQEAETGLYFTSDGLGINPITEIEEVKDADADSPFGKLSKRFKQVEEDIDDEVSDLEERIAHLEYQVREELGAY